jgi:hypothetical protein
MGAREIVSASLRNSQTIGTSMYIGYENISAVLHYSAGPDQATDCRQNQCFFTLLWQNPHNYSNAEKDPFLEVF